MALSTNDEIRIREYLLGKLSEEEQQQIEERLMLENDLFEELEISKGELIEDYRSGDLTQAEREWFEQHYLATAEGKRRYTFAVALSKAKQPGRPLMEKVGVLLKSQWSMAIAPILLLLVGISIFMLPLWKATTYATLRLPISSPARDGSLAPPGVRLDGKDELRISLVLPIPTSPAKGYHAELFDSRVTKRIKVTDYNSSEVAVVIPATELSRGQYIVKLFAIMTDGQEQRITGSYSFKIE